MTSDQIRSTFLGFFERNGHHILPSSSLIPVGDNTGLMLVGAGVNQIQPFFMGTAKPPSLRLASCQKCFRTTDIETVGNERNLTFFEMLGNFSVGDYFKEGAIALAWELLTKHIGLSPEVLNVTVHPSDAESPEIWHRVGVSRDHIFKLEDNWWHISGSAGPCGPDTEIYVDRGADVGCRRPECAPGCDCDRFLEIWNLVLTEFEQDDKNQVVRPLASKNIDTGAGLERWSLVLQHTNTVYETDLFAPILDRVQHITGSEYGKDEKRTFGMRVLADHARSMTFLVGDGLEPANEGRGYILRRIIRRAVRHAQLLGVKDLMLQRLCEAVIERMSGGYPELARNREDILTRVEAEEIKFRETLAQGLNILMNMIDGLPHDSQLPGEAAFRLYDTYGFPLEVTKEILAERGYTVDETSFLAELQAQRNRSRASIQGGVKLAGTSQDAYREVVARAGATQFLGYETTEADARVAAILVDGQSRDVIQSGEEGELVLDRTPFYGTGGGQLGDTGRLSSGQASFVVGSTTKPLTELIVHHGHLSGGALHVGDTVLATVNESLRWDTARNHTGTHILHAALRKVLGEKATQAGSVVEPDRLRFDFHYAAPLTDEQLREVERIANEEIRRNDFVLTEVLPLDRAMEKGAMGLFEEKYGDQVRIVEIPGYSMELCGGTHCRATGQIGELVITSQESIGSGVRRIEALTGRRAAEYVRDRLETLRSIQQTLPGTSDADLPRQIQRLQEELARKDKQIDRLKREGAGGESEALVNRLKSGNGATQVVAESVPADNRKDLLAVIDRIKTLRFSGVVTLGAAIDDKPAFVTYVTKDLVERGVAAPDIVVAASSASGGKGGGGRPDVAQGGGTDPAKLAAGLEAAAAAARAKLG
ncbi:MAG: alanine--tRNA ligase [Chloroflexi bacterium]|nr:alanine--tRNA ligase [Chloroflexota bacterium]